MPEHAGRWEKLGCSFCKPTESQIVSSLTTSGMPTLSPGGPGAAQRCSAAPTVPSLIAAYTYQRQPSFHTELFTVPLT